MSRIMPIIMCCILPVLGRPRSQSAKIIMILCCYLAGLNPILAELYPIVLPYFSTFWVTVLLSCIMWDMRKSVMKVIGYAFIILIAFLVSPAFGVGYLLKKMALSPLFGMNNESPWQCYSNLMLIILVGAVVVAVVMGVIAIVFELKNKKYMDFIKALPGFVTTSLVLYLKYITIFGVVLFILGVILYSTMQILILGDIVAFLLLMCAGLFIYLIMRFVVACIGWVLNWASIGKSIAEDKAEAVKRYRMAAEQGRADAQFNLGRCHYNGDGVAKDKAETVKCYREAALQGDAYAQYRLSRCYFNGEGVAQDKVKAMVPFRAAAKHGQKDAIETIWLGKLFGRVWRDLML